MPYHGCNVRLLGAESALRETEFFRFFCPPESGEINHSLFYAYAFRLEAMHLAQEGIR